MSNRRSSELSKKTRSQARASAISLRRYGQTNAFSFELESRSIPFLREVGLTISYKGRPIPTTYRVDFVCYESVLVEIKALSTIGPVDDAQLIHYLKAARVRRGLLINFGGPSLQYRRRVWDEPHLPLTNE